MREEVKTMWKEAGILFAITLISGLLLGLVYQITLEPIRRQEQLAIQKACSAVFAQADHFQDISVTFPDPKAAEWKADGVVIGRIFRAEDSADHCLGYVLESVSSEGYGGEIVIYLGVTLDGRLNDISILEISETAGLGMKAGEVLVPQFHDKRADDFTYTKSGSTKDSEIDAISGATITTKAVLHAVNAGIEAAGMIGGDSHE